MSHAQHITSPHIPQSPEALAVGHIAMTGALSIVIAIAAVLVAWALMGGARPDEVRLAAPRAAVSGVEQTLLRGTSRGANEAAAARRALEATGWVDRESGVARVPNRARDAADRGELRPDRA